MKKIAFIDRDGTIIYEPKDTNQINGLEQLEFLPNVISSLKKLQNVGFELVIVSNQDGLGSDENSIENYELINNKIKLANSQIDPLYFLVHLFVNIFLILDCNYSQHLDINHYIHFQQ